MSSRYEFPRFKVAAVQAGSIMRDAPQYFDTEATLEKGIRFIEEAGRNGARLVVFPETWLPCFPYWSVDFNDPLPFRDTWAKYLWSSIEVPGPETEALCDAARRANAFVVMGINERDKLYPGRMYNSVLYISTQGTVLGTHRKICNTVHERLFHTPGDGGANLRTVFKTEIGSLGGSICGEHSQLPLVYYWAMQGIQLHCSLWPGTAGMENVIDIMTRSVCFNTHSFGVLAAAYFPESERPASFYRNSRFSEPGGFRGGSAIVDPRGEYIAGPVFDKETIVYGDVDLSHTDVSRYGVNLAGIYSRWDLISLQVREEIYAPAASVAVGGGAEAARVRELEDRVRALEQQVAAGAEASKSPHGDGVPR